MNNLIGQTLGRYHITDQLGEGGMATVYKAFDTRLESDVAVKVIRTERLAPEILDKSLKRFEREAKSLAKLTHPNIVKVTDYGEHEGRPYLVMPYLPGGTLKNRLKAGPIPWQETVQLLLPIAHALEYAHEHNLIHRDVKPSNVLLTDKGQPMLTDFGVAKLFDVDETAELTGTGMGIGTPEYMAPEQWTGHVTPQTDIYALGVVFYEMVTGRKPYQADTPAALLLKQANDPLPRPRSFVSGLPDAVEKVLFKALAKSLENRYQGMGEMVKAMEGLLAGKQVKEVRPARRVKEETLTAVEFGPDEKTQVDEKPILRGKSTRREWVWGAIASGILLTVIVVLSLQKLQSLEIAPAETSGSPNNPIATLTIISPSQTSVSTIVLPTQTSTSIALPQEIVDDKGVTMRLVPAGEFTMGSDNGAANEKPIHDVYLDSYYMDIYEVTNKFYKACVNEGVCEALSNSGSYTRTSYYGNPVFDDYPVVYADWYRAKTYCEWRGGSLPTEAQWEKAARGTDSRTYPWGEQIDTTYGNFGYSIGDTTVVGNYPKGVSPYGMYDMAGNVWEWVADWYSEAYYQSSPLANPFGPSSGSYRVTRGGSWTNAETAIRSSFRHEDTPESYSGFRCVQAAPTTLVASQSVAETPAQPTNAEQITDSKGVTMRLVPVGEFTMGSDNGSDDEKPMRQVYLDAFYMDKYEVTNAFYKVCVDAGVCYPPNKLISSTRVSYYGNPQYDNFPVIYVNWNQAKSYCEWRGTSLPTESQWEKAARGIDGRIYPWGNEHIACQNNSEANSCGDDTMEVGSYEGGKSPYGLYDMGGNVFEWVENWYDAYPGNMLSDPNYGTKYRIVRGGSWYSHLPGPITYFRFWEYPDIGRYHIGFRCARSAEFTNVLPAPSTPVSSETSTGELIHANAVVNSSEGGGANLRAQPAGKFIATLENGTPVELLGETQEANNVTWVKIAAVKNGNQIEGWVMQSVLEFPTPTPTPTP